MLRVIFGVSLLLSALALASAAPVPTHIMPKGDPLCYPTRVGDRLVHQQGDGEIVHLVKKVEKVESGTSVTLEVTDVARNSSYLQTVIVSPTGVAMVEFSGQKLDPPLVWLKLPHQAKNEWKGTWAGNQTFEFESKEWEMLEVPAGKFKAIRVERKEYQNEVLLGTTTYWYSPGLGCIKVTGRSPTRVLKSMTPGKG